MRFMVYRARTGAWLDRDLQGVHDFEVAEVLSGPARLNFTVEPEMRNAVADDGLRVLEDWGSVVVAVDEDSWAIQGYGIVVPSIEWEDETTTVQCIGVCGYPQGFIYEDSKNWGPNTDKNGNVVKVRPDPLAIVKDLWNYTQSFPNSDLGVSVKYQGKSESTVRVGSIEEPYRLRWWESPDIGQEIDTLASDTPFDYRERAYWKDDTHQEVRFEVIFGWPRLGKSRDDLSFQLGVNIIEPSHPQTAEDFANTFLGIGNGEGTPNPPGKTGGIVNARYAVDDGRLRRTLVYTDKTLRDPDRLHKRLIQQAAAMTVRTQITEVEIRDHPDARLSDINVGDDVFVDTFVPSYGDLRQWVRVVEKSRGEYEYRATLSVEPTAKFIYSPATPNDLVPSYKTPDLASGGIGTDLTSIDFTQGSGKVAVGDWVFLIGMGNWITPGVVSDPRFTLLHRRQYAFPWYLNGSYASYLLQGKLTTLDPLTIQTTKAASGHYAWVVVRGMHPTAASIVSGDNAYSTSDGAVKDGPNTGPAIAKPATNSTSSALSLFAVLQEVVASRIDAPNGGWQRVSYYSSTHADAHAYFRGDGPVDITAAWCYSGDFYIGAEINLEWDPAS